jgi:hypothetical protein
MAALPRQLCPCRAGTRSTIGRTTAELRLYLHLYTENNRGNTSPARPSTMWVKAAAFSGGSGPT